MCCGVDNPKQKRANTTSWPNKMPYFVVAKYAVLTPPRSALQQQRRAARMPPLPCPLVRNPHANFSHLKTSRPLGMFFVPPLIRHLLVSKLPASTHAVSVFPVPVEPVSATTSGSCRPDRWLPVVRGSRSVLVQGNVFTRFVYNVFYCCDVGGMH